MKNTVEPNIRLHRMGTGTLSAVRADGSPIADAEIRLTLRRHDFRFGCNLFMLGEMETEEKNERYKEAFARLFNYAVVPFYWRDLEPEQGKPRYAADSPKIYRRPAPDLCVAYCRAHGIRMKGHCLVYPGWTPDWMPRDIRMQKILTQAHIEEAARRYERDIEDWDVENENLCFHEMPCFRLAEEPDFLEWCYDTADRAFTSGDRMFINEASFIWKDTGLWQFMGTRSPYYMQIDRLLRGGHRVDAVGLQFHQFIRREQELEPGASLPFDPRKLYAVMDCYGRLNRPLHVSEITIPAYTQDPDDEETQALLCENLYRTWFSHPAMDGIVYWNLPDGYAAFAPRNTSEGENYYAGGLLHYDLSEKPAARALYRLIHEEWHTDAVVHTDAEGRASFDGFFGDYDASVAAGADRSRHTFRLTRGD
ncbi:MAG: endo-1,4-beta-xylanase, partial [Eubacteriales bacterium]